MEQKLSIRDLYQRYLKGEITYETMDQAVERRIEQSPSGPPIVEAPRRPRG